MITVRYWAGARRAAGLDSEQFAVADVPDVAALRRRLSERAALAAALTSCSLLVDEVVSSETTTLTSGATVDVLPPFAGG